MHMSAPPYVLVSAAQVVLGTSIGGQFIGADRRVFITSLGHGVILLPLMLGACTALALAASHVSGTAFSDDVSRIGTGKHR